MEQALTIIQIVLSVLLILAVITQSRGAGLGDIFGGGGEMYRSKRGLDKITFVATIVLAVLFLSASILRMLISQ